MNTLTTDQAIHPAELGREELDQQQFLTFVSARETYGISILADTKVRNCC